MSDKEKIWKTHGVYSTFTEASSVKETLLSVSSDRLVKIRRCGKDGSKYKVKTWTATPVESNKKSKKKAKKKKLHNKKI